MQRVAVTGGSGLLGQYVVAALVPDYEVTVLDRAPDPGGRSPGPVDMLDLEALSEALRGQDAVIHLAAIDAAVDAPPQAYFHTNTLAAWNVLHAGHEAGVRRFALCSSSSAYGLRADGFGQAPEYLQLDESHPLRASDPYGLSKRVCETIGRGFASRAGISVAVLRPCYVAFATEVSRLRAIRAGEEDAFADRRPPPLPPLGWFVAPEDVAACFRRAIEVELEYDVFNVSATETFVPQPTLARVQQVFGVLPEVRNPRRFESHPHASPMDCSHAEQVLGWTPKRRFEDSGSRAVRVTPSGASK